LFFYWKLVIGVSKYLSLESSIKFSGDISTFLAPTST